MKTAAVIQFPGSNCEHETAAALKKAGLDPHIFRWNRHPGELKEFDGYVLPGGFSYQDRVRAGAVAAKKSIMRELFRQAQKNKPVLGICNGAQILVESGILPGITPGRVEMAVAPNRGRTGYYCGWIFMKASSGPPGSAFTGKLSAGEIIPAPVAHAEGRFAGSRKLLDMLCENSQVIFRYSTPSGETEPRFPDNPNGSADDIAGLSNPEGNVLGLMPHPERAAFMRQVPYDLQGDYGDSKRSCYGDPEKLNSPGPGMKVFLSMAEFLGKNTS